METVTRQRVRHAVPDTSATKVVAIEAVAREFQRLVRWTVHRYWAPTHLGDADRPRRVVKAFRASPERALFATLNSHLQQEALSHGLAIVRAGWEQAAEQVRGRIARRRRDGGFSDTGAHELNWLLRWPSHLATILAGGIVVPDDERFATNDHERLDRWLRYALRRARPAQPKLGHAL